VGKPHKCAAINAIYGTHNPTTIATTMALIASMALMSSMFVSAATLAAAQACH
jgi:hypothetical protein